jgi:hypothetical protein
MNKTVDEIIEIINQDLNEVLLAAEIGIKDIWFSEKLKVAPSYPAVQCQIESTERNELQVNHYNKIGWDLNYLIKCYFSGSEGALTLKNAERFVNKVENTLDEQIRPGKRLNNHCFTLECTKMVYGEVALELIEPVMVTGGVILLNIKIFQDRLT